MAEPTAAKVTIITLLAGTAVGGAAELLVQWMGVIVGAGVGGLIACSFSETLAGKSFFARFRHWGLDAMVGALSAPVAFMATHRFFGPLEDDSALVVLPFVAMLAAGFWRNAAREIPAIISNWRGKQ